MPTEILPDIELPEEPENPTTADHPEEGKPYDVVVEVSKESLPQPGEAVR